MKALLLLVSLLFFTACSPTIKHVKRDLDKSNFKRAMYDLKKMRKTTPDKVTLIYESAVKTLIVAQIQKLLELAISKGGDIDAKDSKNFSLLDYAKRKGDIALIRFLLEQGATLSNVDGMFTWALKRNDTSLCNYLFAKGYHYSKAGQELQAALKIKDYDTAMYWLSHKADINDDPLAMREAVDAEDLKYAHFLLDHGFKIKNDPLLFTYVIKENKVMFIPLLMAEKVDLNADKGLLPYVLQIPDYPLADYLFANKAKLDAPMLIPKALAEKNYTLIHYLIKHGEKPKFPENALEKAFEEKDLEYAKVLIKMGVPFNSSYTPLTYCAKMHYKEGMQYLVQNKADVNDKDSFGRTALMYLVDDIVLTDWLVHNKADINAKDKEGRSILMYAVGFSDVAQELIDHGADIHIKDKQNRPLLSYAVAHNNMDLVKDLVEYKEFPINEEDDEGQRPLNFSDNMKMTRYLMKHNARN